MVQIWHEQDLKEKNGVKNYVYNVVVHQQWKIILVKKVFPTRNTKKNLTKFVSKFQMYCSTVFVHRRLALLRLHKMEWNDTGNFSVQVDPKGWIITKM